MLLLNKFHTSYCTNIHPGQDWPTTFASLKKYLEPIRSEVAPGEHFGVGLRLSDQASRELGEDAQLKQFKQWLESENFYVFTMNGFPYGAFHGTRVKDRVHDPDWTRPERLEYTLRLFRQLGMLLPRGMDGGISTSPISYKHWHATEMDRGQAMRKGARNMAEVALALHRFRETEGTTLHLDIEPEPDGLLENSEDVVRFWEEYLMPEGIALLMDRLGIGADAAREALNRHITLCYDICHFALAFERPEEVISKLDRAGIRIGKIQVSAALRIRPVKGDRSGPLEALKAFDEPIYLHQVTERTGEGVKTYPDLPECLNTVGKYSELRAHFHVPIFTEKFGMLEATQPEILEVLELLKHRPFCSHLEVETYTWDVLPPGLKQDLSTSIARELRWLKSHLQR